LLACLLYHSVKQQQIIQLISVTFLKSLANYGPAYGKPDVVKDGSESVSLGPDGDQVVLWVGGAFGLPILIKISGFILN